MEIKVLLSFSDDKERFFCFVAAVQMPPDPAHGHSSCVRFTGGTDELICQVSCDEGYTPERPHAGAYLYSGGRWISYPIQGYEFPWADCVPGRNPSFFCIPMTFS